jgi:hypothetical protein
VYRAAGAARWPRWRGVDEAAGAVNGDLGVLGDGGVAYGAGQVRRQGREGGVGGRADVCAASRDECVGSENPLPAALRTTTTILRPPQRLAAALVSCRPHPLTRRLQHSERSSVGAMGLFSHEEFRDPDEGVAGDASGGAVERARGADVDVFGSDHPVVVGPGLPPEDGSCGQFAVQFHVSTSMLVGLKRIADMRGVSVPEVCRQVIGVFVAQQEGELGALLAAEAEVADYRPSLGDA